MSLLTFVTSFRDIGRDKWDRFSRPKEPYFNAFKLFYNYFRILDKNRYRLVIFCDDRYTDLLPSITEDNIITVPTCDEFFSVHIPVWSRLDRERAIMNSQEYKDMVSHMIILPERREPLYTMINHAKIDFIRYTIDRYNSEYYSWVDFGYYGYGHDIIINPIDMSKISKDTITYGCLEEIDILDKDPLFVLYHDRERVGGCFFIGSRKAMIKYQKLYHDCLDEFQRNNMADDDQHLVIRCYVKRPELFTFVHPGKTWHDILKTLEEK
jgi:hypothetical protein